MINIYTLLFYDTTEWLPALLYLMEGMPPVLKIYIRCLGGH